MSRTGATGHESRIVPVGFAWALLLVVALLAGLVCYYVVLVIYRSR
jgi:hypothetical protein